MLNYVLNIELMNIREQLNQLGKWLRGESLLNKFKCEFCWRRVNKRTWFDRLKFLSDKGLL